MAEIKGKTETGGKSFVRTEKMRAFCREFLIDWNGTQAALRAGYPKTSARSWASRMLKREDVQSELNRLKEMLPTKQWDIADVAEVLAGYTRDIRFDPRKLYDEFGQMKDVKDLDDATALSLAGMDINETITESDDGQKTVLKRSIKYKYPDKIKNRDSLGKHFGIFEKDNTQKAPILILD